MSERAAVVAARVTVGRDVVLVAVTTGLFIALSLFWLNLLAGYGLIGNDGLVYRAGAAEVVGGDPWSTSVNGYTYAAPPLTAFAFLPAALIPESVFRVAWIALCAASAVVIVRRLGLAAYWLAYPPLVFGVLLGNPSIPGMALVLSGAPVLGLALRPHLALVARPRAVALFGLLSLAAIALRPDFVTGFAAHAAQYVAETGGVINWWGSPLMVLPILSLALLRDRRAFGWLVVPAIAPAMGWYGFAMVMPVRDRALALACAIPLPGVGAAAITVWALLRRGGSGEPRDAAGWGKRR